MARRYPYPRHFRNVRGATPDDIAITLADFAAQVSADQEIVELGVFQGRTALMMAWGAREHGNGAHVTGIDPWDLEGNVYDPPFTEPGSGAWARHHIQSLGYSRSITLIQGFSLNVAAQYSGPPVGLLFVDGDHTKEGALQDIYNWASHLAPGAVIAVDDYGHPDWPGVKEAVDELVADGFLAPVAVYHERLAVTKLAAETALPSQPTKITAITGEGVSPSPYPAVEGQVAAEGQVVTGLSMTTAPLPAEGEVITSPLPAEGEVIMSGEFLTDEGIRAFQGLDIEVSSCDGYPQGVDNSVVREGEVEQMPADPLARVDVGTPIEKLNLVYLKALAKARGIKLGARKDKRDLIIQALIEGK